MNTVIVKDAMSVGRENFAGRDVCDVCVINRAIMKDAVETDYACSARDITIRSDMIIAIVATTVTTTQAVTGQECSDGL